MAPQTHVLPVRNAIPGMPPPPPPAGLNYIAPIKVALRDLLITHSFSIILVALLVALLYFSTKRSRRQPIFLLNVFTILLALSVGGLVDYQTIQTMIAPLHPTPLSINITIGVLGAIQSILIDTTLLLRLLAVYPLPSVGPKIYLGILVLPVVLKIARVINLVLFIRVLADATRDPLTANILIAQIWERAPYLKIEWFAQLFDNTYASAGFLYKLSLHNSDHNQVITHKTSESSFAETIKTLLWVASTNFVFPVLFSLAQIIIVYREVDVLVVNDIVLINTSIAVIGVVFATVWAGTTNWARDRDRSTTRLGMEEQSRVVFQQRSALEEMLEREVGELHGDVSATGSFVEFKA